MSKRSLLQLHVPLALVAAAVVSGCAAKPPPHPPIRSAMVIPALPAQASGVVVTGLVRSQGSHQIAAETGGTVLRLHADVGDRVQAGQVLAELDAEPSRLQAAQAAAQLKAADLALAAAGREEARLEGLVGAGAASAQDLDQARTARQTADAQRRAAAAQARLATRALTKIVVRAPASGVVAARQAELSAVLAPGAVLFLLDTEGPREIAAAIPGKIAAQFTGGDVVTYRYGGVEGAARLMGVSARAAGVDARQARFMIQSGSPPNGAAVELRLAQRAADGAAVTVPLSAVLSARSGARRVLVVDQKGATHAETVDLLGISSAGALVRGRVRPGQTVIAAGGELIAVGERIRPLPFSS